MHFHAHPKSVALVALTLLLLAAPATAAATVNELDARPHVEVTGNAEVKVVPDEFVIRATIQSFDEELSKATRTNEAAVRKAFLDVKKLGLDRRYIVTDDINVNAITEGYRERSNFKRIGYSVSRNITVILHDPMRVEPTMKALFGAGVDRLSMSLGHTEIDKKTKAAQAEAARDARAKASLLTSALGQTLGAPVAIVEISPDSRQPSNFVYSSETSNTGDALSIGKLKVRASVRVKFLLE